MFILGFAMGAACGVALYHFWPTIKAKIEKLGHLGF